MVQYKQIRALPAVMFLLGALLFLMPQAQAAPVFDAPDLETDRLVDACMEGEGVFVIEGTDVICYNDAIYPEQFLKLNEFAPASRIIITSPGGNVATARLMSSILDRRGEPAVIAGQCMSACAMVLLPGLDDVHIHHTAHIAVHGITMMDYRTWWGWLKNGEAPSRFDMMRAQMGYDFGFTLHASSRDHMEGHLEGQDVDMGYITEISEAMLSDAVAHDCRVDPKNYWGMINAEHIQNYLSDRVTRMEAFAQSWDGPNNKTYKSITKPVGDKTYVFKRDYAEAVCP